MSQRSRLLGNTTPEDAIPILESLVTEERAASVARIAAGFKQKVIDKTFEPGAFEKLDSVVAFTLGVLTASYLIALANNLRPSQPVVVEDINKYN